MEHYLNGFKFVNCIIIYFRDPFYVVDPANPFNNVLTACNCWDMIAAKAKSLMQAQLFKECVDGQCGWQ